MRRWLNEKDALLYERASERDSKLGQGRKEIIHHAPKIWLPNTNKSTSHHHIVSNLHFIVRVHKRK
jgi:hypothetical protein